MQAALPLLHACMHASLSVGCLHGFAAHAVVGTQLGTQLTRHLGSPMCACCCRCLPQVGRFYMQPRADRSATYRRWWGIVKKEAKHYWVRLWLLILCAVLV